MERLAELDYSIENSFEFRLLFMLLKIRSLNTIHHSMHCKELEDC